MFIRKEVIDFNGYVTMYSIQNGTPKAHLLSDFLLNTYSASEVVIDTTVYLVCQMKHTAHEVYRGRGFCDL